MPRPAADTLTVLVEALEAVVDEAAAVAPNPGYRTFQRLNRAEYERTIRDLLGLEVDAGDYLPPDARSANFDNIADVQMLSPTLLTAYLRAADDISALAVGNPNASPVEREVRAIETRFPVGSGRGCTVRDAGWDLGRA